jgi:hypothetical protein
MGESRGIDIQAGQGHAAAEGLDDLLGVEVEIHHGRGFGSNGVGVDGDCTRCQVEMQLVQVGTQEKCAVVEHVVPAIAEGVTGYFFPTDADAAPAHGFGVYAELLQDPDDPVEGVVRAVAGAGFNECVIQVPEIVIDRSAAGDAACEGDIVVGHGGQVAFQPGILVLSDDDAVLRAPEEGAGFAAVEEGVLGSEIPVCVQALGEEVQGPGIRYR